MDDENYMFDAVFGEEWADLDDFEREMIRDDFCACEEDGVTRIEYQKRIGNGNLRSYVDTLWAGVRNRT